ncbi:hypothetical protein [Pseudanabaena sp. ABRG5-3]|uniref:hypothetical protein n=1 Tax=Pseudanabaena sp. ABRG5-3 TaxID=685565 RepID=UPI000DC72251|nr:hypothetical protein [Pseudanabaena sp. ABRG5-3]BBC26040.1 hypothetical protein ABRG53_3783 [Pseudanabaena sp. ABRG5-3]
MLLQELKNQANKLPVNDRLELVRSIIDSIQEIPSSKPTRTQAINRMKGLLKTSQPSPTDAEVESMLEQHRMEKYL